MRTISDGFPLNPTYGLNRDLERISIALLIQSLDLLQVGVGNRKGSLWEFYRSHYSFLKERLVGSAHPTGFLLRSLFIRLMGVFDGRDSEIAPTKAGVRWRIRLRLLDLAISRSGFIGAGVEPRKGDA